MGSYMWASLAGATGYVNGAKLRDYVASKMTSQQIAEAQKGAQECQQRNFKNCD